MVFDKKLLPFEPLRKLFVDKTIVIEQDDIPAKLLELRNKFKKDIDALDNKDKKFMLEDDNWF